MRPSLESNDAVTRVLCGDRVDHVPVAQCYEFLGPLQFHAMEVTWGKWWDRLEGAGTDLLPVSYQAHLDVEMEVYGEIFDTTYLRPAWTGLPRNESPDEFAGTAVARRDGELFWVHGNGKCSWIPPHREAEQAASVAERSAPWAGLWDRSSTAAAAISRAAARPTHGLRPAPYPADGQADAIAHSHVYDLARRLVERYPDRMPLYTAGVAPYDGMETIFGFEGLMAALIEQPALVHRILEHRIPSPSAQLLAERQMGVRLMFIEECMASADILSPKMYLEFVHRYDRSAIELYEEMGFRTVLYFSGNLMPFLPYLAELPFTALAFEEDRKNYGIDLAAVRRALPDKVLFGNTDAAWLEKAKDQEVLDEVKRQIDLAGPDRFIVSCGSPMTPETSLERVRLFCESTRLI